MGERGLRQGLKRGYQSSAGARAARAARAALPRQCRTSGGGAEEERRWGGGGLLQRDEPAAGSSMGPQRLRHHAEEGAGSGGDTRGRSSDRLPAPGEQRQVRSDGRRRKQGGRGREKAHLFAARRPRRYRRGGAVGRRRRGLQGWVGAGLNQWESVPIQQRHRLQPANGFNESGAQEGAGRAAVQVRCHAIIQFQHGSFTLQAPNTRCASVTAGALGFFLLLPPTPRAGVPRTRKYMNTASSGARNSSRYRLSSFSLDPTGVHFASNHDCKLDRPTRDLD